MNMLEYTEHFKHFGPATEGGHTPEQVELVETLEDAINESGAVNVLEIGFNQGGSTLGFLLSDPNVRVTSVDVNYNTASVEYLRQTFGDRFTFILADSRELHKILPSGTFDFVHIDGNHNDPFVEADVVTSIGLGIPYLYFDDTNHQGHPNIARIVNDGIASGRWSLVKHYPIGCGKTLVKV